MLNIISCKSIKNDGKLTRENKPFDRYVNFLKNSEFSNFLIIFDIAKVTDFLSNFKILCFLQS